MVHEDIGEIIEYFFELPNEKNILFTPTLGIKSKAKSAVDRSEVEDLDDNEGINLEEDEIIEQNKEEQI